MKRKFNVYCILMLVATVVGLTIDFSLNASTVLNVFKDVSVGTAEGSANGTDAMPYTVALDLEATENQFSDHRIIDRQTGKPLPAKLARAIVRYDNTYKEMEQEPLGVLLLTSLCSLISIVALVALWVYFIKLVLAVNRGMAFDRIIEHRLRMMGILLLVVYASSWAFALGYYAMEKSVADIEGYRVVLDNYPSLMELLSGLGMLMIAQIFSIGRQMKEEQELTI